MLNSIKNLFTNDVYIQIWENRIKVTNVNTQICFDEKPLIATEKNKKGEEIIVAIGNSANSYSQGYSNPFSHPRMLLNNFAKAEKIIQYAIREVHKNTLIPPAPLAVIHPMDKLEGGLTDIELRAFRELGYGAGARDVYVYTGPELSTTNFNYKEIVKADRSIK